MRILILALLMTSLTCLNAQVSSVTIKATGLTCSMCSNSIDKALRGLSFVSDVQPDLPTTSFVISFKPGEKVDFDAMKDKVEGAGFFIGKLTANFSFENLTVGPDFHYEFSGDQFHFLDAENKLLNGAFSVQLMDKGFVSHKEFKSITKKHKSPCLKTGKPSECCKSKTQTTRIYHVTLL